jgi:signal transduction histidine kinase
MEHPRPGGARRRGGDRAPDRPARRSARGSAARCLPRDLRGASGGIHRAGGGRGLDGRASEVDTGHDAALAGASELERRVGAAARLAVDNERLRAGVLAQLEDLRASRARIVEAGDTVRRRIERDLHDGAQQRLLAVSFELRMARAAAEAGGDPDAAAVLATSCDRVQAALTELRDLAHGIYPAILTEAGLGPALETLADDAPLPVEIRELPGERFAEAVERSAYIAVSEAVAGAATDHVEVDVHRAGDVLLVDLGPVEAPLSVQATDRVGALGGRTSVEHGRLRIEIPCA